MKISKKLAWCFIVLISVMFFLCISLFLVRCAVGGGSVSLCLIHDNYAESQAYKIFFTVFKGELIQFVERNRDKISGQHRIFVLEFYRVIDPTDKVIFIYLDLDESLKNPILIGRERIDHLIDAKSIRVFTAKTIENLSKIFDQIKLKRVKNIPGRNSGFCFARKFVILWIDRL